MAKILHKRKMYFNISNVESPPCFDDHVLVHTALSGYHGWSEAIKGRLLTPFMEIGLNVQRQPWAQLSFREVSDGKVSAQTQSRRL